MRLTVFVRRRVNCMRRPANRTFLVCLAVLVFSFLPSLAQAASLSEGVFHVEYSGTDTALPGRALDTLRQSAAELAPRLPTGNAPIRVVLCTTVLEFMRYAGTYTQPSVSGVAQSEAGVIAVKAPPILPEGGDFLGTLRHELIHVLLARNVDLDSLPRWLNEGVTMTLSREYRWESRIQIAEMYLRGQIINYPDLDFALAAPGSEMQFGEAYAQSLSMTRFLFDRLGEDQFWSLLLSLRDQSFSQALQHHTGWAPGEFFVAWKQSLWKLALVSTIVSGFSLFQVMAILVVVAYWRKWRRGKRIMERWEREDGPDDPDTPDDDVYEPWNEDDDDGEDDVRRW